MKPPLRHISVMITGAPGAGKSTLARMVHTYLHMRGLEPEVIDGDVLRSELDKRGHKLGWSEEDMMTQADAAAQTALAYRTHQLTPIVNLCAPLREAQKFIWIKLTARLDLSFLPVLHVVCEAPYEVRKERRTELYEKLERGELPHWTEQQRPVHTHLRIDTHRLSKQLALANTVMAIEALTK